MKNKALTVFCLICFLCFLGTYAFYLDWYNTYGIPFGRGDVDNYMCWMGYDLSYRVVCPQTQNDKLLQFDYVHSPFILLIKGISKVFNVTPAQCLTFFIPFLLWIVLPAALVFFSYSILKNLEESIIAALFCLFGSSMVFYYGVVAIWSQFLGFILFLFGSGCRGWFKKFFIVLSIVFYPHLLGVYLVMYIIGARKNISPKQILFIILLLVIFLFISRFDFLKYTRWNGVNYSQPDTYTFIYVILNPILFILFFIGADKYELEIIYPLIVVSFISDLGRLMIIFIPLVYIYSTTGLLKITRYSDNPELIYLILGVCILVFFNYLSGYYYWPTIHQMSCQDTYLCRNMITPTI